MRIQRFTFLCLACTCLGRRVQTAIQALEDSSLARHSDALQRSSQSFVELKHSLTLGHAITQQDVIATGDGFISELMHSAGLASSVLQKNDGGIEDFEYYEVLKRIITNPTYNSKRVIGAVLPEDSIDVRVDGMIVPHYLWKKKGVVPFILLNSDMEEEKDGVQMMKPPPHLQETLAKAISHHFYGAQIDLSVIKKPHKEGIRRVVAQQFARALTILSVGLVPILRPRVLLNATEKEKCEEYLLETILENLDKLAPHQRVMFELTLPTKKNLYLPVVGHANTIRVTALSGGRSRAEACALLAENPGMIASFSRAFSEGLHANQTDEEFAETLDTSCQMLYDASLHSKKELQMAKIRDQPGFFSALDQSGGSTPKALAFYGIDESEYRSKSEMFQKVHDMRTRMVTNPKYNGARVVGAILFEMTMDRKINGMPTAKYLWDVKKVVPFLKIDKGLAEPKDGCQLMKDMPELDKLLDKAVRNGIFGTKERSLIKEPNEECIKKIVEQQFEVGLKVIAKGLVPMLEPEVDIQAEHKEQCEELLLKHLLIGLKNLTPEQKVIFKLSIPTRRNMYKPLMEHPNTVKVVALSGGYTRDEACKLLSANNGMIGSFSRAFAEGLSAKQTDREFTEVLDKSCDMILEASRT